MSERVCGQLGCDTRLVSFNPWSRCYLHMTPERKRQELAPPDPSLGIAADRELQPVDVEAYWSGRWA